MSQNNSQSDSTESNVTTDPDAPKRFPIPIAIDPLRILAGILTRWYWLVAGALLCGVIGALVGMKIDMQTFSLSAALIKRKVPQTVQTTEIGQPFRPADFNDATLLSTLLATEPLDWAGKAIDNGLDGIDIATRVEASQLDNTDIYYITYHSPVSSEDAVKFVGLWSEEILEYTQRLQQSEARIVRDILAKEVRQLEFRIDQTDQRIIDFAKRNNFIGGESQVAAILGKISQIDLNLQAAEAQKTSLLEQIQEYRKKIQHHSPLEIRLRESMQELASLRSTYTDQNPLVKSKLESISYFEAQINELDNIEEITLEKFTGTDLGNTLYLNIIGARNSLTDAQNRIKSLTKQREVESEKLKEFPSIIARHKALVAKRDSLLSELSLLSKRLKETEIFASSSPGYFQIFEEPDIRKVVPSSLVKKPLILGIVGFLFGGGIALLTTTLMTQRSSRRSTMECCAVSRVPLVGYFEEGEIDEEAFDDFWLKHMAMRSQDHPPVIFWTIALNENDEKVFWEGVSRAAKKDVGRKLKVHNWSTDEGFEKDTSSLNDMEWAEHHSDCSVWRLNSLPEREKRELLNSVDECYSLIKTEKMSLHRYKESRELFEIYFPACRGTIVTCTSPNGRLRTLADKLSTLITIQLSSK